MSAKVPRIVASVSLQNQTQSPNSNTTVLTYTPTADSQLRVSANMDIVPQMGVSFTAVPEGNFTNTTGTAGGFSSSDGTLVKSLLVKGSTALNILMANSVGVGSPTSVTYNCSVVIEEL